MVLCTLIVIHEVICIEYRVNRESCTFFHRCEDRADTYNSSAVVVDCLNTAFYGISGRDGCGKDQDMLSFDHHLCVVTEDELAACRMFGSQNINSMIPLMNS